MKVLRVNKILRALGCSLTEFEHLLGRADLNPNCKMVICLDQDFKQSVEQDLAKLNVPELVELSKRITDEVQLRQNQAKIAELESELRSKIWTLRDLGVNTLAIDGLTISLAPTFNYDPNE